MDFPPIEVKVKRGDNLTEYIYDKGDTEVSKKQGIYKPIRYVINENGCWVCVSHYKDQDGYAIINRNGKAVKVHRYVYQNEIRLLKDDEVLLHSCDNPTCCNPEHLRPGTHAENQRDKALKGRSALGSQNGASKLTESQVIEIFHDKRSLSELGKVYGVGKSTISQIKRGKSWRYLNLRSQSRKE